MIENSYITDDLKIKHLTDRMGIFNTIYDHYQPIYLEDVYMNLDRYFNAYHGNRILSSFVFHFMTEQEIRNCNIPEEDYFNLVDSLYIRFNNKWQALYDSYSVDLLESGSSSFKETETITGGGTSKGNVSNNQTNENLVSAYDDENYSNKEKTTLTGDKVDDYETTKNQSRTLERTVTDNKIDVINHNLNILFNFDFYDKIYLDVADTIGLLI